MLFTLVQENYTGIVISLLMVVFILTNPSFEKKITVLFLMTLSTVFILIIVDITKFYFATRENFSFIRSICTAISYILRPMVAYEIIIILRRTALRRNLMVAVPLIINGLVVLASCFTSRLFYDVEDSVFQSGMLEYVSFAVSGFYLIFMGVETIRLYKDGNRMESAIGIVIVILNIVSTLLEVAYGFEGVLNTTCAISIIFYYLFLHTQRYKRDTLTNVLNRRCFYLDAQKLMGSSFIIVSVDLNNLKQINDTKGHAAGDVAICTMVECIRKNLYCHSSRLYRIGGDEFMMICLKQNKMQVVNLIENIKNDMKKTNYSCAIGIAIYEPGDDFDKVCCEADTAMYDNKKEMKNGGKENEPFNFSTI